MENFNHTQIVMNPISQLQLLPTYSNLISPKFPSSLSILDDFEVNHYTNITYNHYTNITSKILTKIP